jgi:hypothetical protein
MYFAMYIYTCQKIPMHMRMSAFKNKGCLRGKSLQLTPPEHSRPKTQARHYEAVMRRIYRIDYVFKDMHARQEYPNQDAVHVDISYMYAYTCIHMCVCIYYIYKYAYIHKCVYTHTFLRYKRIHVLSLSYIL